MPSDPVEAALKRSADAWNVASLALDRAAEAIAEGDARSAKDMSISLGILIDKAEKIAAGVKGIEASQEELRQALLERVRFRMVGALREIGIAEYEPSVVHALQKWFGDPCPVPYPDWVENYPTDVRGLPAPTVLPRMPQKSRERLEELKKHATIEDAEVVKND